MSIFTETALEPEQVAFGIVKSNSMPQPVQNSVKAERVEPLGTRNPPNPRSRAKNARKGDGEAIHAAKPKKIAPAVKNSPQGEAASHSSNEYQASLAGGNLSLKRGIKRQVASETRSRTAFDAKIDQGLRESEIQSSDALINTNSGQNHDENHISFAGIDSRVHLSQELHSSINPAVSELVALAAMRRRWHKAEKSLTLQAKAMCRSFTAGDKDKANALYDDYAKGKSVDANLMMALRPFEIAMQPFQQDRAMLEKTMRKLARSLPVWKDYVEGVKGFGDLRLAVIVGECGDIGSYKSVAAIWKRMGLAVINGERQRRVAGEAALEHGYNPERRSVAYLLSGEILKAQIRGEKDDDGKKTGTSNAIGPMGELYLKRKEYELPRVETKAHAHNRASRHVAKETLKRLYLAWNKTAYEVQS